MKELFVSIIAGLAAHFTLYGVCKTLPYPDLSAHAAGIMVAYPIARHIYQEKRDFDLAFLVAFLGVGIGVFIGRVLRGVFREG